MDHQCFQKYVLTAFEKMPSALADRIFKAFDTGDRGHLDLQDFLCGIAILTHGSAQHRMRLIFAVYDVGRTQYVTRDSLERFIHHGAHLP